MMHESLYSVVSRKRQYCVCVNVCIVYTWLAWIAGNEDGREEEE